MGVILLCVFPCCLLPFTQHKGRTPQVPTDTLRWRSSPAVPHTLCSSCMQAAPSASQRGCTISPQTGCNACVGWLPTVTNQGLSVFRGCCSHSIHFFASFMLPFWGWLLWFRSFFLIAWLLFKPDDSHLPLKRPFRKVEPYDHPHAHTWKLPTELLI